MRVRPDTARENGMNDGTPTPDHEAPIYDAVRYVTKDQIERTVRRNAAARCFDLRDEHLNVIRSLIAHYKRGCCARGSRFVQEAMHFLEEAYEFRGGRAYLHSLFEAVTDARGILARRHELAGLPALAPAAEHCGG